MILDGLIISVSLLVLLVLLNRLRRLDDPATTFLFAALWGRYLASSLSDYTLMPVVGGLRLVALYTLLVLAAGFLFIPLQHFFRRHLFPFYLLFGLAVVSNLLNGEFFGLVEFLARWGFFVVVALLLYRAFEHHGLQPVLVIFIITLSSPVIVQFLSIALGQGDLQADGNVAYISGYPSASTFSQVAFTLICVSAIIKSWRELVSASLSLVAFISIYLAFYRTVLLGALPIFGAIGLSFVMRNAAPIFRPVVFFSVLTSSVLMFPVALQIMPERLIAAVEFAKNIDVIFEPTINFNAGEYELGTGRARIWSNLIHQWREASTLQHVFGFGAGALPYSPHGEYIGFFYHLSFPGLILLLGIFGWQAALIARIDDKHLAFRLMACLGGYMVVCVATSPLWQIEGFVALALICATTWAAVDGALKPVVTGREIGPAVDGRIGARWNRPGATVGVRRRVAGARSVDGN